MTKQFWARPSKQKSKDIMSMGAWRVGRLVRLTTGHKALGYFANKVDHEINPTCRFCEQDNETFWHFCSECPVFREGVADIMLDCHVSDGDWTPLQLLQI